MVIKKISFIFLVIIDSNEKEVVESAAYANCIVEVMKKKNYLG